jgi:iron(III) transport system substrate-binding protein
MDTGTAGPQSSGVPDMPALRRSIFCALLLLAAACSRGGEGDVTTLVVYTTAEGEELAAYKRAFEAASPDIRLNLVRDSTGVVTARLLAERGRHQADVIWGLAATSLLLLAEAGLLEPYAPAGSEAMPARFKDAAEPPRWVGLDAWMVAICANTRELEARGLGVPASWAELADPRYRGQVVMPHPASSGVGYATVSGWIQTMGEPAAWAYMDALHENVAQYVHSGSKPCKMAGAGEYALGISFDFRALTQRAKGEPVQVVFPAEGSGWDLSAAAILRGTPRLGAARRLMDWAVGPEAMGLYNEAYAIVTLPGAAKHIEGMPADPVRQLVRSDFAWAAGNRERVLREWARRYEAKSEAK